MSPNMTIDQKHQTLKQILAKMGRVLVAYSGGADSALLLRAAVDVLGDDALAVTAVSPSLPAAEREAAAALAEAIGARHTMLETHEFDLPAFRANDPQRCYHCKRERFAAMAAYAQAHGCTALVDGSNAEDSGDYRPGSRAAREHGVRSPLAEAGFNKADVRVLARRLGLPMWDKPAAACLASRVPYGMPVSPEVLAQIEQAEAGLHALGFPAVRVRHHGDVARVEVPPERLDEALSMRMQIIKAVHDAGYTFAALDLEGYRTGSLNKVLDGE